MGSYTQLIYHIVFCTKYRRPSIAESVQERLYEYIGGIIRANKGHLIEIGGVKDHVHVLACLSPSLAVSDVIRDVKAGSSKWMHQRDEFDQTFEWQKGYGAFTVSYSNVDRAGRYIRNQERHHKGRTFRQEYIALLNRHGVEFRLEYLFEDEHHG